MELEYACFFITAEIGTHIVCCQKLILWRYWNHQDLCIVFSDIKYAFTLPSSDGTYCDACPGLRPTVTVFRINFSPTCFDILGWNRDSSGWNFVYHFNIFMHVRSSSNAIDFRQFLQELRPFWTSNSYKHAVFRTFCLHALTYWAEILHMTLFKCTTYQVRVSSPCVNFWRSYGSFELRI